MDDLTADDLLDPITIEILHNAIRSVMDEMFVALMKSAYSTNIKERRDHSTSILDARGRLIAQAENALPIHLGSMMGLIEAVLAKYPMEQICDGDIFVANDPHVAGGTHLPDVNLAMPVFVGGQLVCFVCNIAHHADIGGMAPGSMAGGMSEIYQEGLRIPVIKLYRRGELNVDVFDLLLLNVRVPNERRGDFYAQIASCRLGYRRISELSEKYPPALLLRGFDEIIRRTEQRLRASLRELRAGTYTFEDVMDDDGLDEKNIPIRVKVTVGDGRIKLDFAGTSRQVPGNINCTINAVQSTTCYVLKALLDPDLPNNQGVIDAIEIVAERGSLLNAQYPAAVASRAQTCQRVIDVIIGALADAIPDRVVGAANGANTTAVFSGTDPATQQEYVYLETLGGGFGGRATKDGKDGVQVHITNTSNLPIEAIETEYPLLVEEYGFAVDTGGAGRFRGGLGLRRVIRPIGHVATFSGSGERFTHAPWGVFGGSAGAPGRFMKVRSDGHQEEIQSKPNQVRFGPEECIVLQTPGAGGYGPASMRTRDLIADDAESGKFTPAYLKAHYGFEP